MYFPSRGEIKHVGSFDTANDAWDHLTEIFSREAGIDLDTVKRITSQCRRHMIVTSNESPEAIEEKMNREVKHVEDSRLPH